MSVGEDTGSFCEYPDTVVCKAAHDEEEIENIYRIICKLTENKELYDSYSRNTFAYASEFCDLNKNGLKYFNFFKSLKEDNYYEEDRLDRLLDGLDEFNLFDDAAVNMVLDTI